MTADELEQIVRVAEEVIKEQMWSEVFDGEPWPLEPEDISRVAREIGRRIVEENIRNAMPKPKEV